MSFCTTFRLEQQGKGQIYPTDTDITFTLLSYKLHWGLIPPPPTKQSEMPGLGLCDRKRVCFCLSSLSTSTASSQRWTTQHRLTLCCVTHTCVHKPEWDLGRKCAIVICARAIAYSFTQGHPMICNQPRYFTASETESVDGRESANKLFVTLATGIFMRLPRAALTRCRSNYAAWYHVSCNCRPTVWSVHTLQWLRSTSLRRCETEEIQFGRQVTVYVSSVLSGNHVASLSEGWLR